jgi:hypothetical protein
MRDRSLDGKLVMARDQRVRRTLEMRSKIQAENQ